MAFSTTPVDTNRGTSDILLTPQMTQEVIAGAISQSAIMQLVPQVKLPGTGIGINVILGEPNASWVAESTEKPVDAATVETKYMIPYKLAVIELFSNELKRDLNGLYDELVKRLPGAIARTFDATVFAGVAPGTGFDVLTSATVISAGDIWGKLVAAKSQVATAGGNLNAWAVSPVGEAMLYGATDLSGRPLFLGTTADGSIGRILGAPVVSAPGAHDVSNDSDIIGGDWSMARWGIVEDIKVRVSEEATINDGEKQVNLWQRNMFAVMVEAELGFVCADAGFFAKIENPAEEEPDGN